MDFEYNITYRQKNKGWQYIISFKDQNGKWKQRSKQGFKTKRAAQKAADERLYELKEHFKLQLNSEYEGITFGEFADMFIEHLQLYKEHSTITTYECAIKKFEDLKNIKLSKVTSLHVQRCVDNMVKEGLNPSTIKVYCVRLKTVFNNAIKPYKIITQNPATDIIIPENKQVTKLKALTKSQLNKLLSSIKNMKYYIVTLIAAKSGLRVGEIIGLTWNDIDFARGTIEVNKQWKRLKGGKWGFGPVKRKNSNRTVPVSQNTLKELAKYKKASPASIDGRIVPYANTVTVSRGLKTQYRKAGFNITVHDLRHTYATLLIANGVDFETTAQLLGHDVRQTMETYSHVTNDMLENASKAINKIF